MGWIVALALPAALAALWLFAADRVYLTVCRRQSPRQLRRRDEARAKQALAPCANHPPKDINDFAAQLQKGAQWAQAQPAQRVSVKSEDGLTLAGHFYTAENCRCTMLCVHGYHSEGMKDFGVILPFYLAHGCSVLVADQRCHGDSEGRYITFGVKESRDVCRWAEYLAQKSPGMPIFLDGVSMGASSVLMSLALTLPAEVQGVIADCGYTTPTAIFKEVLRGKTRLPAWTILPAVSVCWRLRAGCAMTDASAPQALAGSKMPVLFVHGALDTFVPPDMGQENYCAAAGEKELVLVPGAGHAASWLVDEAGCQEKLLSFLQAHLSTKRKEVSG